MGSLPPLTSSRDSSDISSSGVVVSFPSGSLAMECNLVPWLGKRLQIHAAPSRFRGGFHAISSDGITLVSHNAEVTAAAYVVERLLGYLVFGCGVVIAFRVISHESESSPVTGQVPTVCGRKIPARCSTHLPRESKHVTASHHSQNTQRGQGW